MRPAHGEWGLPETRRDGIGQCLGAVSGTPVDRDDRHAIQQTGQPFRIDATAIAKRQWIGNGVLGNSLEDESLLCEFVGAPAYELLLQEPVGGFDHGVVVRVALP